MEGRQVLDSFPLITQPGRRPGELPAFGGSQNWLSLPMGRYSGCGPVAVANLFAQLAATRPALAGPIGLSVRAGGPMEKEVFLPFMEKVYRIVGTRGVPWLSGRLNEANERTRQMLLSEDPAVQHRGLRRQKAWWNYLPVSFGNSAASLLKGVERYTRPRGFSLQEHLLYTHRLGYEEGLAFLREGLSAGVPVVLLTWLNRHEVRLYEGDFAPPVKITKNTEPHFLTVAALRPGGEGPELLVSDRGMRAGVPYEALQKSWQSPFARGSALLYLTPKGE